MVISTKKRNNYKFKLSSKSRKRNMKTRKMKGGVKLIHNNNNQHVIKLLQDL